MRGRAKVSFPAERSEARWVVSFPAERSKGARGEGNLDYVCDVRIPFPCRATSRLAGNDS